MIDEGIVNGGALSIQQKTQMEAADGCFFIVKAKKEDKKMALSGVSTLGK